MGEDCASLEHRRSMRAHVLSKGENNPYDGSLGCCYPSRLVMSSSHGSCPVRQSLETTSTRTHSE